MSGCMIHFISWFCTLWSWSTRWSLTHNFFLFIMIKCVKHNYDCEVKTSEISNTCWFYRVFQFIVCSANLIFHDYAMNCIAAKWSEFYDAEKILNWTLNVFLLYVYCFNTNRRTLDDLVAPLVLRIAL